MSGDSDAVAALQSNAALGAWLRSTLDVVADAPVEFELISGGHSNLTVGLRVGGKDLVLRRPPIGAFLPSANDMQREHTFLSALAPTAVPTPKPVAYHADADLIGAPFYVMERLHGVVPHEPAALAGLSATEGRRLSEHVVDVLVDLHAVEPDSVGLGGVAKPTGYLQRQVGRWVDQYERSKDGIEQPALERVAEILRRAIPQSPRSTIVHGDYRLGNLMVASDDRTRIVGVFDWEMATLGDPLSDVGYAALYWGTRNRPRMHPSQACADLAGFLTAEEVAERYASLSGRDVGQLTFYVVLAAFKLAVIGLGHQAIRRRTGAVAVDDQGAGSELADWALELGRSLA